MNETDLNRLLDRIIEEELKDITTGDMGGSTQVAIAQRQIFLLAVIARRLGNSPPDQQA